MREEGREAGEKQTQANTCLCIPPLEAKVISCHEKHTHTHPHTLAYEVADIETLLEIWFLNFFYVGLFLYQPRPSCEKDFFYYDHYLYFRSYYVTTPYIRFLCI